MKRRLPKGDPVDECNMAIPVKEARVASVTGPDGTRSVAIQITVDGIPHMIALCLSKEDVDHLVGCLEAAKADVFPESLN